MVGGIVRVGIIHPRFQSALGLVERCAIFCHVQFNVQKCECICFREKNVHIGQEFESYLYRTRLAHVKELRYLGVLFDEALTWRRQIHESISRARTRL